jgi:hypothetical protein
MIHGFRRARHLLALWALASVAVQSLLAVSTLPHAPGEALSPVAAGMPDGRSHSFRLHGGGAGPGRGEGTCLACAVEQGLAGLASRAPTPAAPAGDALLAQPAPIDPPTRPVPARSSRSPPRG